MNPLSIKEVTWFLGPSAQEREEEEKKEKDQGGEEEGDDEDDKGDSDQSLASRQLRRLTALRADHLKSTWDIKPS